MLYRCGASDVACRGEYRGVEHVHPGAWLGGRRRFVGRLAVEPALGEGCAEEPGSHHVLGGFDALRDERCSSCLDVAVDVGEHMRSGTSALDHARVQLYDVGTDQGEECRSRGIGSDVVDRDAPAETPDERDALVQECRATGEMGLGDFDDHRDLRGDTAVRLVHGAEEFGTEELGVDVAEEREGVVEMRDRLEGGLFRGEIHSATEAVTTGVGEQGAGGLEDDLFGAAYERFLGGDGAIDERDHRLEHHAHRREQVVLVVGEVCHGWRLWSRWWWKGWCRGYAVAPFGHRPTSCEP